MKPEFVMEIYLQPGEIYWGDESTRIKTLLGSCVSICIWHPKLHIGGMSHCLLPSRLKPGIPDPRYVDDAVGIFLTEIAGTKTRPSEYEVKIFGGSEMFFLDKLEKDFISVGRKNVETAHALLTEHGFRISAEHTGGAGHRNLIFDLWSGDAWLKHVEKQIHGET